MNLSIFFLDQKAEPKVNHGQCQVGSAHARASDHQLADRPVRSAVDALAQLPAVARWMDKSVRAHFILLNMYRAIFQPALVRCSTNSSRFSSGTV